MNLLKKLTSLFTPPASGGGNVLVLQVQCSRCGEVLPCRINLANDLSIQYGKSETDVTYICRKVVIGEHRCFQKIEVELVFDSQRKILEKKISGGKILED
jgi:hypothetical protein